MAVAAPAIVAEMADWVALGGRNSGIVGDPDHRSGFHRAANEVPASDYSRRRDPNGADGPFTSWSYACAGDFWHGDDPALLARHRRLLERLEAGDPSLSMICEFIGQPDPDRPVIYWSRWGGRSTYRGPGHGTWSHIAWYRSRAHQRAHLWEEDDMTTPAQFLAILRDPNVAAELRRLPWQYIGGGLPTGKSALGVFAETHALVGKLGEAIARESANPAEVRALLAELPRPEPLDPATIVAGVLDGLDPAAIAAAIPDTIAQDVADELATRLGQARA